MKKASTFSLTKRVFSFCLHMVIIHIMNQFHIVFPQLILASIHLNNIGIS